MKPYFSVKSERHAVIMIPGNYRLKIDVKKTGADYKATFIVPLMLLTRSQARAFVKACEMALNFATKASGEDLKRGGGGGRVPYEFNDGKHWFYFGRDGRKMSYDGQYYDVPGGTVAAPELRRYRKVVGEAVKFKISRLWRKFIVGGWNE